MMPNMASAVVVDVTKRRQTAEIHARAKSHIGKAFGKVSNADKDKREKALSRFGEDNRRKARARSTASSRCSPKPMIYLPAFLLNFTVKGHAGVQASFKSSLVLGPVIYV